MCVVIFLRTGWMVVSDVCGHLLKDGLDGGK